MKAAGLCVALGIVVLASASAPVAADAPTTTFLSGCTEYDVPAGAQVVVMRVIGAPGGDGEASGLGRGAGAGGAGADIQAFGPTSLIPNKLYASVGSPGDRSSGHFGHEQGGTATPTAGGDPSGGDGGDGSDVRTGSCDGDALVIAGGGGGGGGYGFDNLFSYSFGGKGGSGDADGLNGGDGARGEDEGAGQDGAAGGLGAQGATPGTRGTTESFCDVLGGIPSVSKGGDGSGSTGGAGGAYFVLGDSNAGGGGGGGYAGGAGGDAACSSDSGGGGGGAGSSHVDGSILITETVHTATNPAQVIFAAYDPPGMTLVSILPPPNGAGWRISPVAVTWLCTPQEGAPYSIVKTVTTAGANQSVTGTCLGPLGTFRADTQTGINIELDPPTVDLSPQGTLGLGGWYVSNVVVKTQGTATSGIASCTADQTISTDTAGTVVNGSCTSVAGRTGNAAPLTIKRDATPPAIGLTHTPDGTNGWNKTAPVQETVAASDATSGLGGAPSCTDGGTPLTLTPGAPGTWTVSVSGSGTHALSCAASDVAGNTATATDTVKIDTVAPTLTLPADIEVSSDSNGTKTVTFSVSSTDDQDPAPVVNCNPASGFLFPIGDDTVSCTSTDRAGNTVTRTFHVVVLDARPVKGDLRCNGVYGAAQVKRDVIVKAGEVCILIGTHVGRNLQVQPGGAVAGFGATVSGLAKLDHPAWFKFYDTVFSNALSVTGARGRPPSGRRVPVPPTLPEAPVCGGRIGNALQLTGNPVPITIATSPACATPGLNVGNAVQLTGNTGSVTMTQLTVGNAVQLTGNTGGVTIRKSKGRVLQCTGNNPLPGGGNNTFKIRQGACGSA